MSELFGKGVFNLEKLLNEQEEYNKAINENMGAKVFEDADTQAKTFSSSMNKLNTIFTSLADKSLAPLIDQFSTAISGIDQESLAAFMETAKGLGFALFKIAEAIVRIGAAYNGLTTGAAEFLFGGSETNKGITKRNERYAKYLDDANRYITEGKRLIEQGKTSEGRAMVRGGLSQAKFIMNNPELFENRGIGDKFKNSSETLTGQLDAAVNNAYDVGASKPQTGVNIGGVSTNVVVQVDGASIPSKAITTTRVGRQYQLETK
jgi:hypothetical protein